VIWKRGEIEKIPMKDASVDIAMRLRRSTMANDPAESGGGSRARDHAGRRVLLLDMRAHEEAWVRAKARDRRLGFAARR